jgi:tetratricopeptide (TPR) repeat protein
MRRLEAAAASIGPDTPPLAAAWLHYSLGIVFDSMPERALSEFERAGALFRSLDDAPALGDCLYRCGRILADRAEVQAAEAALVESEKLLQSGDYPKLLAFCRDAVGHLNMHRHDYRAARACFEHALCLFRDAGALQAELVTLNSLADATWALGDLDAAAAAFDAAIQLTRGHPLRRKRDLGFLLLNCAGVLTERGRLDEALDAAREGVPLLRETGYAWIFVDHLACRVALAGGLSDAARLAGFADAGFVAHRRTREPNEARARSRLDALLRERLDTAALGERIAEGAAMGADEAFAIALMPSHQ